MLGTDDDATASQQQVSSTDSTPAGDVSSPPPLAEEPSITAVGDPSWQHPGEPIATAPSLAPEVSIDAPPVAPPVASPVKTTPLSDDTSTPAPAAQPGDDIVDLTSHELIDIKQKALGQINPLMDHLDQTPEEKFRTTMMMIQASDDQALVKTAYEAAQKITDEKAKAQALLDIVNEINYFTQHHNS